jgi:hypothetical protein
MNANLSTGIFGEYRIIVKKKDQVVQDTGWFKNLILNSGLDFFGNVNEPLRNETAYRYCKVGTGTSTPIVTQTALDSQLGETAYDSYTTTSPVVSPDYINQNVAFYEFDIGQIVGTIAEIGVGWISGIGSLFSRALILDALGNPTTITLTSINQLQVYYRLNFVPSTTDFNGSFVIGSTTYNYTGRHSSILGFNPYAYPSAFNGFSSSVASYGSDFTLEPITNNPGGTFAGSNSSKTLSTYISGNYYLDITYVWDTTTGNGTGGIKGFNVGLDGGNTFQIELDQAIPKDATKTLSITIRNSWNRI